jgi:two-component system, OmpR family, sensor histidine kinase MtrB
MVGGVRLGLRARATVAWAVLGLVLSVGLALLAHQLTRTELVRNREDAALRSAYLNARVLRSALRAPDAEPSAVLSSLEGTAGTAVLANVGGEWFAGSVGLGPERLPDPLTERVLDGDAARQLAAVDSEPYVAVGVPVAEGGIAFFELVPLTDVEDALAGLARGLAAGAAGATALAAAAGWYVSGRVLSPLQRMAGAAEEIAGGHLEARLDAVGDPDLEPLERSFNHMADAVQERLEREQRFTADVSHELRSPLAAMASAISIARRHRGDPEAVDAAVSSLEDRTSAFQQLVLDLLEISRIETGVVTLEREHVEPRRMVQAALAAAATQVPIDVAPGTPHLVAGDRRRLARMVMGLLENAERYAGGATRIELDGDHDVLRIAVEDGGPGVPEHERRYIFERFARGEVALDATADGSGLGLALVAEHARLHAGRVWVEDAEGGGARFVIEIPTGVEG